MFNQILPISSKDILNQISLIHNQAAQKDLESKDSESSKLQITRSIENEDATIPAASRAENSDESNLSDDQDSERGAKSSSAASARRLRKAELHESTASRPEVRQAAREVLQTPAAPISRPAPPAQSRLPSCSTVTFAIIIGYLILAFYELYTVFTPQVPRSAARTVANTNCSC